ncbi:MAG TPA: hypothetical protein VFH61_14990 [Thermoleophilia bacterium]|nr:hypothetical protein [Thermoleophilia bacterium]
MDDRSENDRRAAPVGAAGQAAPPASSGGDDGLPSPGVPGPDGSDPRPVPRATPDLGLVAVAAGLISLLARSFLMADPTARYVVLAAALTAVALGAWSLWVALRHHAADVAVALAAIITGGLSLYLYVSYVTAPPGST